LPSKTTVVFIAGFKETSDASKYVRFTLGYEDALAFYTTFPWPKTFNGQRHNNSGQWTRIELLHSFLSTRLART